MLKNTRSVSSLSKGLLFVFGICMAILAATIVYEQATSPGAITPDFTTVLPEGPARNEKTSTQTRQHYNFLTSFVMLEVQKRDVEVEEERHAQSLTGIMVDLFKAHR